ncbi:hypothetical protein F4861DRAFT_545150 [Xylaria intraflava]|nr:hypothetical protein F4861DRAFT_545150 [Xylaria intraflava]
MSFGYAVGDVIAVLGLFERVAIELRNYKDAPAHFQQLSAELDLLRSTLQHVLQLHPKTSEERQTLEKIRAIAIHCLQPLQTLAAKMQTKQSSLGQFRTTGTLRAVGTRLHWSMVAQKDVDELRKTVLSEMVAINMLLSVQQLGHIKQLSDGVQHCRDDILMNSDRAADALTKQTSMILSLVADTPEAIANLRSITTAQVKEQSRQTKSLSRGMKLITSRIETLSQDFSATSRAVHEYTNGMRQMAARVFRFMQDIQKLLLCLSTCTKEMLQAISRNARMLLDIANQMKHIARAIEAIPLHLTVDIIRLDDALGETWGLPMQACGSWGSFCNLLEAVVFANGRVGAHQVLNSQFTIALSKTGQEIQSWEWEKKITAGAHIEQAIIVSHTSSNTSERCLRAGCDGSIINVAGNSSRRSCSKCSQLAISSKRVIPILDFLAVESWVQNSPSQLKAASANDGQSDTIGPKPFPKMQVVDDINCFQRVCIIESPERIQDVSEAWKRVRADGTDAAANRCVGLHLLQNAENGIPFSPEENPIPYLKAATQLEDQPDAETWYLLARAYLNEGKFSKSYNALQQAVYLVARSESIWNTIGIFYFRINQLRDSLDALARSIRCNPYMWQTWLNLSVLYEKCRQFDDACDALTRCLELKSDLPNVVARLKVLKDHTPDNMPDDHKTDRMYDHELRVIGDLHKSGEAVDVVINPLNDLESLPNDSSEWESDSSESEGEII